MTRLANDDGFRGDDGCGGTCDDHRPPELLFVATFSRRS